MVFCKFKNSKNLIMKTIKQKTSGIILCLVFGILSSLVTAQYTAVPDPNFENYLETHGMGDSIPNNGQVLTENIENVTLLELSMLEISDLTGIQDFISLEALDISFNQLTVLDVSQNENLETLLCQVNDLNSLTLNNPNLVNLVCYENDLTSIHISNSPLLDYLDINLNYLIGLDVTNNPFLTLIWCWGNEIDALDLTQNTELEMINCSDNRIESLDVTNNPNLVWFSAGSLPNLNFVDVRNGNNHNMSAFGTYGTNNLQCIYVDDADAPYLEDWYKDDFTHFVNNEQECAEMSTTEIAKTETKIHPNPVKDILYIKNSDNILISSIRLLDIMGKLIWESKGINNTLEIDVKSYSKGLYILQIEYENGSTKTKKIIKQ